MTCEEALVLISGELDGVNTGQQRELLRLHLQSCPECRRVFQALQEIDGELSALVVEPPEDLMDRIMDAVRAEPKRSRRRRWQPLAVAAALVLLIGAGAVQRIGWQAPQTAAPAAMPAAMEASVQAANARSAERASSEEQAVGFSVQAASVPLAQELADQRGADVAVSSQQLPELEQSEYETLENGAILYCLTQGDGASRLSKTYGLELYQPSQQQQQSVSYVLVIP